MCPAYEVKVVSVEEFWNNVRPKSEADSTVVFTPALKIESYICVVVALVVIVYIVHVLLLLFVLPRNHNQLISTLELLAVSDFTWIAAVSLGMILQLKKFTIFPYQHEFYGKLSTSYLSFIWVFDLYIYLKIFYILSGSLTFASTWFCLYFLSGSVFFLLFHYTYSLFLPEHLCQGLTTRDRKGGLCLAHLLAAWFVWNNL